MSALGTPRLSLPISEERWDLCRDISGFTYYILDILNAPNKGKSQMIFQQIIEEIFILDLQNNFVAKNDKNKKISLFFRYHIMQ